MGHQGAKGMLYIDNGQTRVNKQEVGKKHCFDTIDDWQKT